MKMADVTLFCKKESRAVKNNYHPVSIFQKYLKDACFKQFSPYFDNIFSKNQCGFRKNYSAQQCLLALLEKWKGNAD